MIAALYIIAPVLMPSAALLIALAIFGGGRP